MRLLKETLEFRANSEEEAKTLLEEYRTQAREKGYTLSSSGYTYKEKKSKGDVIDFAYVCKVVLTYGTVWEE